MITPTHKRTRNFGLDLVRSVAIAAVLLCHLAPGLDLLGVIGVELFFVLSGFLIGSILLKTTERRGGFRFGDCLQFLLRRWFRTLPNYYLFLALHVVSAVVFFDHAVPSGRFELMHVFFLQNFAWPIPKWLFGHSWSLCVEEWFYLLSATALCFSVNVFARKNWKTETVVRATIFALIASAILLRFALRDVLPNMRFIVVMRLDAIMYGVMIALARQRGSTLWKYPLHAAFTGLMMVSCALALLDRTPLYEALSLIFLPLGFALMLPLCFRLPRPRGYFPQGVEAISVWSYSIYLCHGLVYYGFKQLVGYDTLSFGGKLGYKVAATALIVGVSAATYRFFEKPLTDLRERVHMAPPGAAP